MGSLACARLPCLEDINHGQQNLVSVKSADDSRKLDNEVLRLFFWLKLFNGMDFAHLLVKTLEFGPLILQNSI